MEEVVGFVRQAAPPQLRKTGPRSAWIQQADCMPEHEYAAIIAEVQAELERDPDEAREQWGPWLELLGLDLQEVGGHPGPEKLRADYVQFAAVAIWCAREIDAKKAGHSVVPSQSAGRGGEQ